MFSAKIDEIWKQIAEDYIPDEYTMVEFLDYGMPKIIVICCYADEIPSLSIGDGGSWLEAFAKTGYLQGFIDNYSQEEISQKYNHLSDEELNAVLTVVNEGTNFGFVGGDK